jgi:hypothetical protein
MTRIPLTKKQLAELFTNRHKHGIAILETKGLTEEQESQGMRETFQDIAAMGYEHIHTLKIVPLDCGRKPYYVHIDNLNGQ